MLVNSFNEIRFIHYKLMTLLKILTFILKQILALISKKLNISVNFHFETK